MDKGKIAKAIINLDDYLKDIGDHGGRKIIKSIHEEMMKSGETKTPQYKKGDRKTFLDPKLGVPFPCVIIGEVEGWYHIHFEGVCATVPPSYIREKMTPEEELKALLSLVMEFCEGEA